MSHTVPTAAQSDLDGSQDHIRPNVDHVRPAAIKVGLRTDVALCAVVREALLRHYGSVKAMAFELGRVDPSLMNREFDAGKLGRVDQYADASAKSAIAIALGDAFGTLNTPEARIRQTIREMRRKLDEIDQFVESVS